MIEHISPREWEVTHNGKKAIIYKSTFGRYYVWTNSNNMIDAGPGFLTAQLKALEMVGCLIKED
jgi:hypothetical protein